MLIHIIVQISFWFQTKRSIRFQSVLLYIGTTLWSMLVVYHKDIYVLVSSLEVDKVDGYNPWNFMFVRNEWFSQCIWLQGEAHLNVWQRQYKIWLSLVDGTVLSCFNVKSSRVWFCLHAYLTRTIQTLKAHFGGERRKFRIILWRSYSLSSSGTDNR